MKQTLDNELHSIEIPVSLHDRCAQGVRMAAQTRRCVHMKRLTAVAAAAVLMDRCPMWNGLLRGVCM